MATDRQASDDAGTPDDQGASSLVRVWQEHNANVKRHADVYAAVVRAIDRLLSDPGWP